MKAELECLVEELQKKLEKVQQFKGSIETSSNPMKSTVW